MTEESRKKVKWFQWIVAVGLYAFVVCNPNMNPFLEFEFYAGDDHLTNSSWLIMCVATALYWWFAIKLITGTDILGR